MAGQKILVWDAPVRVFHVLLILSFGGAWITAEADGWRLAHVSLGYTVAALVLFRWLWGLVGTRYARLSEFVKGPKAIMADVRGMLSRRADHRLGHNPLGALAIVGMLVLGLLTPLSGWAVLNEVGTQWVEEVHETLGNAMGVLVLAHMAGVLIASWLHRQDLIVPMVTGLKNGEPGQAIGRSWWPLALVMVLVVVGFWALQWRAANQGGLVQPQKVLAAERAEDDTEDD